jgi:hypothetical protein
MEGAYDILTPRILRKTSIIPLVVLSAVNQWCIRISFAIIAVGGCGDRRRGSDIWHIFLRFE